MDAQYEKELRKVMSELKAKKIDGKTYDAKIKQLMQSYLHRLNTQTPFVYNREQDFK